MSQGSVSCSACCVFDGFLIGVLSDSVTA
uniref:Uncharacterized protein n=1 Tax=Anguilla anguilla TaxID=7936 RepID=A0A0E9Q077_ANGAN